MRKLSLSASVLPSCKRRRSVDLSFLSWRGRALPPPGRLPQVCSAAERCPLYVRVLVCLCVEVRLWAFARRGGGHPSASCVYRNSGPLSSLVNVRLMGLLQSGEVFPLLAEPLGLQRNRQLVRPAVLFSHCKFRVHQAHSLQKIFQETALFGQCNICASFWNISYVSKGYKNAKRVNITWLCV